MGTRQSVLPGGLLIPARVTIDELADVGSGNDNSSYTQAGPRPGDSVPDDVWSKMRPAVHHSQSEDVDITVVGAGMADRDGGCQLVYKLGSEAATSWTGWSWPGFTDGWLAIEWTDTEDYTRFDAVVIPSTQEVLVVRREASGADATSRLVDPDDRTVSSVSTSTMDDGSAWNYPALCVLPGSERVLCAYGNAMYYSDDKGTTWTEYSASLYASATSAYERSTLGYHRGELLLLVESSTVGTLLQLASSDLGSSFTLVGTIATFGKDFSIHSTPDGLIVTYRNDANDYPSLRRLSSPFQILSEPDEEVYFSTACQDLATMADPDGVLFSFASETTDDDITCHASSDAGLTWSANDRAMVLMTGSERIVNLRAVPTFGGVALLHHWTANTGNEDNSIGLLWGGGWSSVVGSGLSVSSGDIYERSVWDLTWIPIELPDDWLTPTWTFTGTQNGALQNGGMRINSTSAQGYYETTLGTDVRQSVLMELEVLSGGSATLNYIAATLRVANGTFDYEVRLRLSATGYLMVDENNASATIGSSVTIDLTTKLLIWFEVDQVTGKLSTFHKRPGERVWTASTASGSITNDSGTPDAAGLFNFGHYVASTAETYWYHLGLGTLRPTGNSSGVGVHGRPVGPAPIPVPDVGVNPDAGYLAAYGGPGIKSATHTIKAAHDYPITAVFPSESPSPDSRWRTTDASSAVELVFDLGEDSFVGYSLGLFVAGCNFPEIHLESSSNGGSSWDLEGTLNLRTGFEGLSGARTGDTMRPASGAQTAADRYLWEGELAGGYVKLGTGVQNARRIVWNTQGGWDDSTSSTVIPNLWLDGITGAEATGPTDMDLVWPTGLLVLHDTVAGSRIRQHWRVRIPAVGSSDPIVDAHYEAGVILFGRIVPFGARVSWGRGDEAAQNSQTAIDAYGTSRTRELGPPIRTWSMDWNDPQNATNVRGGTDVDYVGPSSGAALAADDEVHWQLVGLIERLKSGETPVVAIEEIPDTSGTTLTDRSRFLYGRIVGNIRGNNVAGDLGTNEQTRTESIQVREIV